MLVLDYLLSWELNQHFLLSKLSEIWTATFYIAQSQEA